MGYNYKYNLGMGRQQYYDNPNFNSQRQYNGYRGRQYDDQIYYPSQYQRRNNYPQRQYYEQDQWRYQNQQNYGQHKKYGQYGQFRNDRERYPSNSQAWVPITQRVFLEESNNLEDIKRENEATKDASTKDEKDEPLVY